MSNDIKYPELRNSIIAGCNDYLGTVEQGIDLAGCYHGKQGRIRASKAQSYASKITNDTTDDHSLLLALLCAIFNSTSKGLAACIAMRLIQGNKLIVGAFDNDYLSAPVIMEDSLQSSAFPQKMIDAAANNNLIAISDSPCGPILGPDKKQCVRWMLNRQAPSDRFFKHLVQQFKTDLDDVKSSEIDAAMLDQSMACF